MGRHALLRCTHGTADLRPHELTIKSYHAQFQSTNDSLGSNDATGQPLSEPIMNGRGGGFTSRWNLSSYF